ncbi:MAG: hypothetical protein R3266_11670, partial [Gemmatimonadota bacterium]|nr:hypothetical protein [Gemmatimonadota bacterium]
MQRQFDRAVALLHHMTYPAAHAAFRVVTERDPGCALGYWGMAMTLFQPLWPTRPGPEELRQGRELMREARGRVDGGGRESMFVSAGEAFFDSEGNPYYWTRLRRWADATRAIHEAYPADLEAKAFFALAHLAMAPGSDDPAAYHARAAGLLEEILAEEPNHPGGIHYTIHANDFTDRETESLDVVRRYGEIAPKNPHALHMPTHIFVRLGHWEEVVDWNRLAAEAALAQPAGPEEQYVWDEFPHAVEYLLYAHLQRADDAAAHELLRTLRETPDLQPSFKTAFHLASTAARFALERRDWQEAAELAPRTPEFLRWDRYPWPEAISWFARGLGAVHMGDEDSVLRSLDRLTALGERASDAGEFASQIEVLRLELEAWQRFAAGERQEAVRLLEDAVRL